MALPDVGMMTDYIRRAAIARGIDPDVAVRVARSEGLGKGIWQGRSNLSYGRERSFGPFQLHVAPKGFRGGMGNQMIKETGVDPSDPNNWRQGIDFALNQATRHGWGQWYGAKKLGITGKYGISKDARMLDVGAGAPSGKPNPSQVGATPDTPSGPTTRSQPVQPGQPNYEDEPSIWQEKRAAEEERAIKAGEKKPKSKLSEAFGSLQSLGENMMAGGSGDTTVAPTPGMEAVAGPDTALPDPMAYFEQPQVVQVAAEGGPIESPEGADDEYDDYWYDPDDNSFDPDGSQFYKLFPHLLNGGEQ